MKKILLIALLVINVNAFELPAINIPKSNISFNPTIANVSLLISGTVVAVVGAGVLIPTIGIAAGTTAIATTLIGIGTADIVKVSKCKKNQ